MALVLLRAGFTHDVPELIKDLDSVEVGLGRLVRGVVAREIEPIAARVRLLLPFDPEHRGWRGHDERWHAKQDPGHIRDSVHGGVNRGRFSVWTTHGGGPVHWWGGTIRPKGTTLAIHGRPEGGDEFVAEEADRVGRQVDAALDRLLHDHGL